MRDLVHLGVLSIIVTSGKFSPIKSYSLTLSWYLVEYGFKFTHAILSFHLLYVNKLGSNPVSICVVGRGVSDQLLKSTFQRFDDKDYTAELVNTLVVLIQEVCCWLSSYRTPQWRIASMNIVLPWGISHVTVDTRRFITFMLRGLKILLFWHKRKIRFPALPTTLWL